MKSFGGFIIVSGIPASGKSTVALALSQLSSLPCFDKDEFLESEFVVRCPSSPTERRLMSHTADAAFQKAVSTSEEAIAVSWWRHPDSLSDSGTPTCWLRTLPGSTVEIYCSCSPEVAASRFFLRERHPGHFDQHWSKNDLLEQLSLAASMGPIGLDRVVELDTSTAIDINALWGKVRAAWRQG